jgi:hypothetical protein
MSVDPEHRGDYESLPLALRRLLDAELAAGNTIIEVGHSHPAPPAGAYFKLANRITTRARGSSEGIAFYERNGSAYLGEFTDASRFYFILEPPNPPPPEPDMDLIRKLALGPQDPFTQLEALQKRFAVAPNTGEPARSSHHALSVAETATGAVRLLHFRDRRPPHEIQSALERDLMALLSATLHDGRLVMGARVNVVGAVYLVELRFDAALPLENCYALRVETSWAEQPATHLEYYRKTAGSWFKFWTRGFTAADPPGPEEGSAPRYQALCTAARQAEQAFDTVPAIQQAIVTALKQGARFTTSHKEGGTNLFWNGQNFVRSDYGDDPAHRTFSDEVEFLSALRQFYDWETSRNVHPDRAPELVAWKLILRLVRT